MLKAVGRKKPPSPILEDEDAEEMEENGIGGSSGSRPSLDFTSGKMFGSRHSATPSIPEFSVGRAMSPASTIRATTPSISIIENESVWSASSPAASIGRGLNSPLPTLNEIPLASSPLPNYTPRVENRQGQRNMDASLNSNISDMADTRVQKEDVSEGESRKMSPLKEKDNISALSVSSISIVAETVTTSSQRRDDNVSKSMSSNQAEGLNATKVESSDSNGVFERDIEDKPLEIEEESDSSTDDENDGKTRRKHKAVPSPVEKIDIVRRQSGSEKSLSTIAHSSVANTIPEEDENVELTEQDMGDPLNSRHEDDHASGSGHLNDDAFMGVNDVSDVESSERTWDSDFDASFIGSVGELSSTLSASDEESKANSRGGGSASSSSNTEQLMKVRIRRKQLSHHRQRRPEMAPQETSSVSSPRDPSIALRRMLSQSDALTVQRNAQIGRARFERKRAKSALESSTGSVSGAEKRGHIGPCVLCAAEGSGNHAEHAKLKSAANGEVAAEKEKRRISFKDEARSSGGNGKPSPRLPRSGRSSVSQQSPREAGSRRSSITQPSPRETGSRRSSITQPNMGGSEARRPGLGYKSPGGRRGSRQRSVDGGDKTPRTPDILTAPVVTSDPVPSTTPDVASIRDRNTPTSIETPELSGYVRPPSQILSDGVFGSPRDSEVLREGAESVSEIPSVARDYDAVGSNSWLYTTTTSCLILTLSLC
ncbi:hypothetical protein EGW08_014583 [Elysia chlorotica]|uniref:Uncharacterized protein n=1 Tax=Elysia chlorotica TaxID=188477 RepID=A0A3S1BXT6_ELYCH|nr:hypothetical protein EGW08_014583 [Elysia chlorotica]